MKIVSKKVANTCFHGNSGPFVVVMNRIRARHVASLRGSTSHLCSFFSDARRPVQPPNQVHRRMHRPAQHLHCDGVLPQRQPTGETLSAQRWVAGTAAVW